MPTAIYISGLGQSTNKESVEKYSTRYIKELEYNTSGINYYTKVEKIYYNDDQSSLAVRIYQHPKEQLKSDKDPEININIASENVKVYSNPVKDNITIDLTEEGQAYTKIILYNLLGEEVFKSAITSGTLNQIDIANLPSGYYFAKITHENKSIQIKLIKE